jgi:hypothetical protein
MQKQLPIIALLVFAVLILNPFLAIGQLKVFPLPQKSQQVSQTKNRTARRDPSP